MIDVGGTAHFMCDECPIVEQLDRRLAFAKQFPEHGEFQYDHCGCDKVGEEFWMCGYCEDAWAGTPTEIAKSGKRKTGRAYRRYMKKQKFERRKAISQHCPYFTMWLGFDKTGIEHIHGWKFWSLDESDLRYTYIKRPKSSKLKKFYKNYSNRIIRRKNLVFPKGNQYQKQFDYWWQLY